MVGRGSFLVLVVGMVALSGCGARAERAGSDEERASRTAAAPRAGDLVLREAHLGVAAQPAGAGDVKLVHLGFGALPRTCAGDVCVQGALTAVQR